MNTQRTIEINAPAEVLWELQTDIEKMKLWTPEIVSSEPMSPGPIRVGLRSRTKIKEGSRIVDYEGEITACDEFKHLEVVLEGGSLGKNPMRVSYRLESLAIEQRFTMTPPGDRTVSFCGSCCRSYCG